MAIKITNRIGKMMENAKRINGNISVPIYELIDQEFIEKYTDFKNIKDMFESFKPNINEEEFINIKDSEEWNEYIKNKTKFNSWKELYEAAITIFGLKKVWF